MPNGNEQPAEAQDPAGGTPADVRPPPEPRDFDELTRQTLKDVHESQPKEAPAGEPTQKPADGAPPPPPAPAPAPGEPPSTLEGVPEGATVLSEEAAWENTYVPTNVNGKIIYRKLSDLRASNMMETDFKEKSAANKELESSLQYIQGVRQYLIDNPDANRRIYDEAEKFYADLRAGGGAPGAAPGIQAAPPEPLEDFKMRTEFESEEDYKEYQKSLVEHINKQNAVIKQMQEGGGREKPADAGMKAQFTQTIMAAQAKYATVQQALEAEAGIKLDIKEFRTKVSDYIAAQNVDTRTAVESILTAPGWLETQARAAYRDDLDKAAAEKEKLAREAAERKAAGSPGLGPSGRESTAPGKFPTLEKDKRDGRYDFEKFTRGMIKNQTAGPSG